MGWTWRMERADGSVVAPQRAQQPESGFPTQAEAETWVGELWRDLLADGIDAVTLFEEGRRVYGPMSLHAPQ